MPDEKITIKSMSAEEYFGKGKVPPTINPASPIETYQHPDGYYEVWGQERLIESDVDPTIRTAYEKNRQAEERINIERSRADLAEARETRIANAPRILEQGGRVAVYDPATGKITAQTDLLSPEERALGGRKTEADIAQSEAATEASRATTARQQAETAAIETPEQSRARQLALQALQNQGVLQRVEAEREAKKAELDDKIARGIILPEKAKAELEVWQTTQTASLQAALAQQTASFAEQLQRETEAQKYEREKPEREAASRRAEATLEEQRASNAFARERAAAEGQAGILTRQAEAGQSLVKGMVASGVAPNRAVVRMALDPLAQAFQIMQGMVREGKIGPEALPTPAAPTPQAIPAAPTPMGAPLPQAPMPSATGSLKEETERYAAPRPRVGAF